MSTEAFSCTIRRLFRSNVGVTYIDKAFARKCSGNINEFKMLTAKTIRSIIFFFK